MQLQQANPVQDWYNQGNSGAGLGTAGAGVGAAANEEEEEEEEPNPNPNPNPNPSPLGIAASPPPKPETQREKCSKKYYKKLEACCKIRRVQDLVVFVLAVIYLFGGAGIFYIEQETYIDGLCLLVAPVEPHAHMHTHLSGPRSIPLCTRARPRNRQT